MGRIGEEMDIDFVVSTGDNFYDNGLKDVEDPNFVDSFTNVYTPKSLQKQWFSGNNYYYCNFYYFIWNGQINYDTTPCLCDWWCF